MLTELPLEYLEKLATQTILISSLLAGFCITVLANFLISKSNGRIENTILKTAATAAGSFLISIFAFTDILLAIQADSPLGTDRVDLSRKIGGSTYFLGLLCLTVIISLSGWTKSKKTGVFATIIGALTFVVILLLTTRIG